MNDIKDKIETAKDIAHDVEHEIETVAHNTIHPEDETDKEARKRQPWMPIIGTTLIAVILLICFAYFYK